MNDPILLISKDLEKNDIKNNIFTSPNDLNIYFLKDNIVDINKIIGFENIFESIKNVINKTLSENNFSWSPFMVWNIENLLNPKLIIYYPNSSNLYIEINTNEEICLRN